jgi:hypothetical protein
LRRARRAAESAALLAALQQVESLLQHFHRLGMVAGIVQRLAFRAELLHFCQYLRTGWRIGFQQLVDFGHVLWAVHGQ